MSCRCRSHRNSATTSQGTPTPRVEANYGSCFTAKATYGYDGLGQLTTIDYPSLGVSAPSNQPTRQVLRTYEDGRLSKIGTAANVKAFAVLGYHANGMLSSIARERGAATFTDNILPDSAGMPRPGGYTWQYLAGTPGTGEYKYDDVGNLYKIGNDSYGYDNASRLTKATLDGQIRTYAYDAFGNMSQWVDPSGVTHDTKTVAATNRLSETTGATYNERGDLTALSDRRPLALFPGAPAVPLKFQWDALSALTRVDGNGIGRVFLYDADGQRVATLDFKAPGDPSQIHKHWSFRGIDNTVLRDFDRTAGVLRALDKGLCLCRSNADFHGRRLRGNPRRPFGPSRHDAVHYGYRGPSDHSGSHAGGPEHPRHAPQILALRTADRRPAARRTDGLHRPRARRRRNELHRCRSGLHARSVLQQRVWQIPVHRSCAALCSGVASGMEPLCIRPKQSNETRGSDRVQSRRRQVLSKVSPPQRTTIFSLSISYSRTTGFKWARRSVGGLAVTLP